MNLPLPREPRLPWTQRWWTRLFDSGVKWVRLGQYENTSEKTGWDWVEQSPGVYKVLPEVDEAVRSLVENGISIEMQLCYSNPLYQGDPRSRPKYIEPAPASIGPQDKPPNPIFKGLEAEDEIEGFLNYARFMVGHFKGKVRAWEFWNEPNIEYWQPHVESNEQLAVKGRQYGRVLCRFADAVHNVDPQSKVIFGGTSSIDPSFVMAAIASCPSKIDVMAYHAYPGYGSNHAPEEVDDLVGAQALREAVLRFPGIRKDIEFWDNEWNVIPNWKNSNESVQARYLSRYFLEAKAYGVRGFLWEFIPGTDGNENDQYGLLHGETKSADAFQPREAYRAFEVTSALFGQTERDLSCGTLNDRDPRVPEKYSHGQFREYCFRDTVSGNPIYAVWLAVYAAPDDHFAPVTAWIPIPDRQIQNPLVIDIRTGKITPVAWSDKEARTIQVELKDGILAVADTSYLNWPRALEAPGPLQARKHGDQVLLEWKSDGIAEAFEIQRSMDWGDWQETARVAAGATTYSEKLPAGHHISYRVRSLSNGTASAWSNPAWIDN
ncbi:MAG TPA: hypothetical protein VEI54_12960 [Candidatus Limnocylindrales bacterium]|nr:hypothetical protein [Candidatus Limnocylindrales bacterium]